MAAEESKSARITQAPLSGYSNRLPKAPNQREVLRLP